jgi:hypothetical protein
MVDSEEISSYLGLMLLEELPPVGKMKTMIQAMAAAVIAFRGVKSRHIETGAQVAPSTLSRLSKQDTGAGYDTIQKLHAYLLPQFLKVQEETGVQISISD